MQIITIDFETFYSREYSLTKLTTEEYIRGDEFEVIGVGIKVGDTKTQWFSGARPQIKAWLDQFPWDDAMVVAHNTLFDGAILGWIFGIHPRALADTLSMARAVHGIEVGGSLKKLAEHYNLGVKGDEVVNALGKHRLDFSPEELTRYAEYCMNDVDLCYKLFEALADGFPKTELKLIDITLRMFTDPVLELDAFLLEQHRANIQRRKQELLAQLSGDDAEETKKLLMSNPKFAALLESLGVEPPMKISLTTGQPTYAFAKTDEGMKALLEHSDVRVQTLASVRMGVKSTLEETRTERFLSIASRGVLPIPLKYYAAHTGRWGGSEKVNLQNLPSRGQDAGMLKRAIRPPAGYVLIDADSSQIEARILAWMAGQDDLVEAFRNKQDVYRIMASAIYGVPIEEITPAQRFIGKSVVLGCFGPDTQVLTPTGWKRIVDVQTTDTVWDGEEWVKHHGVVPQGVKEVTTAHGIAITEDHEILTEHGWREWSEVATNPILFQSAINRGRLPWSIGSGMSGHLVDPQGGSQLCGVNAAGAGELTGRISKRSALPAATHAQSELQLNGLSPIGGMKTLCRTLRTEFAYLIGYLAASLAATIQKIGNILTMGGGGYLCTYRGAQTAGHSCSTSSLYGGGTTQRKSLTASTTTQDMSPGTCDLQRAWRMYATGERSKICKNRLMTYDIAFAGPRNRYTVATDAGAIIAHNCGYGLGHKKFVTFMKAANVTLDLDQARHIIDVYRHTYYKIPALWEEGNRCLAAVVDNQTAPYGREGVIKLAWGMFHTPLGIPMRYPNLRRTRDARGNERFIYDSRTGITDIWGGKFTENACQMLARAVIGEQMLRVAKRYRAVLTVHDAITCVAPKKEAEEARAYVESCMRWVPEWATGLPLDCESGVGENYGEC